MAKKKAKKKIARHWKDPSKMKLPANVKKALDELVAGMMKNCREDPSCPETEASAREQILLLAESIYCTPSIPNKQLGGRGGRMPAFGGLRPEEIGETKGAVKRIREVVEEVRELNATPALVIPQVFLKHMARDANTGDERPVRLEYKAAGQRDKVEIDPRLFDFLPDLLDGYGDYVLNHLKEAKKHPFRNRWNTWFITQLLGFVKGKNGRPYRASASRFLQAYMMYRDPDFTDYDLNEFETERLREMSYNRIWCLRD